MNLLKILIGHGSRKVTFGWYLFIVSNAYLWFKAISSDDWMTCTLLSTALIGGGTVADTFLKAKLPTREEKSS